MLIAHEFRHPLDPGYTETTNHNDYYSNPTLGIDGYHLGDDWSNGSTGGSVYAVAAGEVVWSGYHYNNDGSEGFGNLIVIRHTLADGSLVHSYYAHLETREFEFGAEVNYGEPIGTVGNTGRGTGAHLHFSMLVGDGAPMPNEGYVGYSSVSDPDIRDRFVDPSLFIDEFVPTTPSTTGPDLVVGNVSVAGASVAYGEYMTVTYDVTNIGDVTAPDHFTRFVFSEDTVLSTDDVSTLDSIGTSLAPGQTIRITSTIPTSIVPTTGSYNLIVVADHTDSVDEQREDNNVADPVVFEIFGGTGGGGDFVDLTVTGLTVDGYEFNVGDQFDFVADIANIGVVDSGDFDIVVYLSEDTNFESDEILFTLDNEPGINAGEAFDYDFYGFTTGSWTTGEYYLAVELVSGDEELGYTGNNIDIETIYLVGDNPEADLTAQNLVLGATVWTVGDSISATWDILNIGSADADATQSTVYLSTDANVTTADLAIITDGGTGTMNPGEVNPEGGGSNGSDPYIVPDSLAPGTYYAAVIVDDTNTVAESNESNESNNTSAVVQIAVGAPDLIAQNLVLGATTWHVGDAISANWDILNIGTVDADATQSTVYLSTDANVTTSDLAIITDGGTGTMNPGEVNPEGGGSNGSDPYVVPDSLAPGTYYAAVIVDDTNVILEGNEGNNTSAVLQITVEPSVTYPDRVVVQEDGDILTTRFDADGRRESFTFEDISNTRGWTSYTNFYDVAGDRISQSFVYDNGNTAENTFVDGQRTQRVVTEADGDVKITTWGADGVRDTFVFEDVSDARGWTSYTNVYDDVGDRVSQAFVFDNGNTAENTFADGQRIQRVVTEADGDVKTTTWGADGVRDTSVFEDISNTRGWMSYTNVYHDIGALETRTRVYDDGRVFLTEFEEGVAVSTTEITPQAEQTLTLSDDFEDGVLATDGWTYLNNASEFDGSLHLEMVVTDQRSRATIEFEHGLSDMTLSYDVFMHAANAYFYGENSLHFTSADGQEFDVRFNMQRTSWAPSYEDDPSNFDLPRMLLIDPDGENTSVFSTGSNTSSYFDDWTRIEIDFDSDAGQIAIDMESDGIADLVIQDDLLIGATAESYTMGTYGWWTGHYTKIDDLDLVGTYVADEFVF